MNKLTSSHPSGISLGTESFVLASAFMSIRLFSFDLSQVPFVDDLKLMRKQEFLRNISLEFSLQASLYCLAGEDRSFYPSGLVQPSREAAILMWLCRGPFTPAFRIGDLFRGCIGHKGLTFCLRKMNCPLNMG